MVGFCLVVELHPGGSATHLSSFEWGRHGITREYKGVDKYKLLL